MIDMGVLRNFIVKVVDSYSRTNALYHNDLHAADVMQTLFTMMMWGDSGTGTFFISSEKLRNLDFSDIFYSWDCC